MKRIYIPFLLALAITACQEGNITPDAPVAGDEMSFNVLAPGLQTKITNNAFEASDVIGLYVTDYVNETTAMPLQISGNRANNRIVSYNGLVWTPEQAIYWGEGKSDVYAYYPYISDVQDVDSQYFEVATDQTGDGYEASDFLWAKAEGIKQSDGAVSLQMRHLLSKLTVKIVAGNEYIGSLPNDASVLLHSTVTGARLDLSMGSVSTDPYCSAKSIKMKELGIRTLDGVDAVVYEAIVVPQMLENTVPLLEINSKSVSYLLEDTFNFRPGVAYTYTATLNTSTTAIKVEIGCELEDWNNAEGNGSGEGGESGEGGSGEGDDDGIEYTDLSAAGTANCYLIQGAGDYKFKSVIGNTDATVGNVKSVEVLWESFGTDEMPNIGDLIASVSYKNGYIRFSTPENFREGNAVIAAKNSNGTILWSWHIWCAEDGWKEQVYFNDAGTMMDRNLGATSSTPGDVGALGLMYQWGRKDPFMGSSSVSSSVLAVSTGTWNISGVGGVSLCEENPMTFNTSLVEPYGRWRSAKTACDPCPVGWRVPDGDLEGVWAKAMGMQDTFVESSLISEKGLNFFSLAGLDVNIYYPFSGFRDNVGALSHVGDEGRCWSCSQYSTNLGFAYHLRFVSDGGVSPAYNDRVHPAYNNNRLGAFAVRCLKE